MDEVKWSGGEANITIIGKEMDEAYIKMVKTEGGKVIGAWLH